MKILGRIENLPYKCDSLLNSNVTDGNNISWIFQKYVGTTKPLVLIPILPNNDFNVINSYIINSNEISTYNQAYDNNGEHKSRF